jgi:hypothetical protein
VDGWPPPTTCGRLRVVYAWGKIVLEGEDERATPYILRLDHAAHFGPTIDTHTHIHTYIHTYIHTHSAFATTTTATITTEEVPLPPRPASRMFAAIRQSVTEMLAGFHAFLDLLRGKPQNYKRECVRACVRALPSFVVCRYVCVLCVSVRLEGLWGAGHTGGWGNISVRVCACMYRWTHLLSWSMQHSPTHAAHKRNL